MNVVQESFTFKDARTLELEQQAKLASETIERIAQIIDRPMGNWKPIVLKVAIREYIQKYCAREIDIPNVRPWLD